MLAKQVKSEHCRNINFNIQHLPKDCNVKAYHSFKRGHSCTINVMSSFFSPFEHIQMKKKITTKSFDIYVFMVYSLRRCFCPQGIWWKILSLGSRFFKHGRREGEGRVIPLFPEKDFLSSLRSNIELQFLNVAGSNM